MSAGVSTGISDDEEKPEPGSGGGGAAEIRPGTESAAARDDDGQLLELEDPGDDAAIRRALDAQGLVTLSIERHGNRAVVEAFPACAGLRRQLRPLLEELTWLRAHSAQQAEGIAWLREEVALARESHLHRFIARTLSRVKGPFQTMRRRWHPAWIRFYSRAIRGTARLLPQPVKNVVKRVWNPWPSGAMPLRIPMTVPVLPNHNSATYDILCFSIIDWAFRWQRPQQLMSKLADAGHRVFFLKTTFAPPGGRSFEAAPLRPNVWEITLAPPEAFDPYSGRIPARTAEWFPQMLEQLRRDLGIVAAVSVVQVPTWRSVAEQARDRFGWKIVYDCMDDWKSFPGMSSAVTGEEDRLAATADVVSVSAERLREKWESRGRETVLVRNAADFEFFATAPREGLLGPIGRPVVGYFGAIARWLDVDLVREVARARPDYHFVLIGGVFDVSTSDLAGLPNVHLLGQQPYASMPSYLASFDVCIIPFVVDEVTAATDPVKFYEYVSLGKPVVATPMPELSAYRDLLYFATTPQEFALKLDEALAENGPALAPQRVALARANTWAHRADTLRAAIRSAHRKVSILIVTWENLPLSRLCLDAVFANTLHPNVEVIVVDNGSTDGTPQMLEELARQHENLHLILNPSNAGFAAANNQALRAATGDVLVLLNNDTVPARGWLSRMLRHLEDPAIGLVVAVTNFSGNESRIAVPYTTLDDMPSFAEDYMQANEGHVFDIGVAAMYCVGLRRDAYDTIGPLDEEFNVGMFEDDDYSHRARLAGLRVVCAEDVFVHHFGQASFKRLSKEQYDAIWRRNQAHYEKKWNTTWRPHTAR